ncbi:MAG TPA: hypothetical protein VMW30_00500 [Candidatus Paceibacterota bacterium]|nr:hypothetical protein [Candidatus Paceibacterota bacterium]
MRVVRRVSGATAVLIMLVGCAVPSHTAVAVSKLPACDATFAQLAQPRVANESGGRIPDAPPGPMRLCRYRWVNAESKLMLVADITLPLAPVALMHTLSQLKSVVEVYGHNIVTSCPAGQGAVDIAIIRSTTGSKLTIIEVNRDGCRGVVVTHADFAAYIAYLGSASLRAQLDAITTTSTSQTKTMPSSLSLCTVANKVTTLTVRRGTFMNPTVFSFPSVVSVSNAASVRAVAKTICAIPPDMRTWAIPCPSDQGLTYRLVFTIPKYVITPIILHMGGCGAIEGTGAKGWIHLTPSLFRVLGNAMQLHLATIETFAGKML